MVVGPGIVTNRWRWRDQVYAVYAQPPLPQRFPVDCVITTGGWVDPNCRMPSPPTCGRVRMVCPLGLVTVKDPVPTAGLVVRDKVSFPEFCKGAVNFWVVAVVPWVIFINDVGWRTVGFALVALTKVGVVGAVV